MKKILIIDLCFKENSLHFKEFVEPIVNIIKNINSNYEIIHFTKLNQINLSKFNKIILCGVALKDFEYNNNLNKFKILKEFNRDVLGICAGAQIIGQLFEAKLKQGQEIGLIDLKILKQDKIFENVNLNEVYCLHNCYIDNLKEFEILATSRDFVQVFKRNNFYAVLFHAEVRNKKLIENFISF